MDTKEAGKLGGLSRAKKLTSKERSAHAKKMVEAREAKKNTITTKEN